MARRTARDSANDTDRIMLGTRFARTSQDARTVHAMTDGRTSSTALCGTTATFGTHGEEDRLPLCKRCTPIAQAAFDEIEAS